MAEGTGGRKIVLVGAWPLVLLTALCSLLLGPADGECARVRPLPAHGRPFFMPPVERERILSLLEREEWARVEYDGIREEAAGGSGHRAAFLYALEGDEEHLATAKKWLLSFGRKGGDISFAGEKLKDPDYFRGGQPWLSPVYYYHDVSPLVAYDWIHEGLSTEERAVIEEGIMTSARFRVKAMDRWTQTANLVFKPTYMVAMAGLATGSDELKKWGFHRKPGSHIGGYFPVLDVMLRDGGPWLEAPIYPVTHKGLLLMSTMSRYLNLYDGQDWFSRRSPGGGSPRGLMDYYIDSAYPIEWSAEGDRQVRIASYGDGATGPKGDLFLIRSGAKGITLREELALAYGLTGDERYSAFLSLNPGYRPTLTGHRPLPEQVRFPPAPSKVWPTYGLAMLRSDERPTYWTSDRALAVFHIMSQGYGHDHRDKFAITLFGAGRLLYPDYNFIQYENPSLGWTRNTIAHNTLMVDGRDGVNAPPSGIRSHFTPDVKYLAVSASGIYEGVAQTRVLMLTEGYLLDVFHAASAVPHTYDYLIHSFGRVRETGGNRFASHPGLGGRFGLVTSQKVLDTEAPWSLDFVVDSPAGEGEGGPGESRRAPGAAVRLSMAGDGETRVLHGKGPDGLAMLAARRDGQRRTAFVALHEPYASAGKPLLKDVAVVARGDGAMVVRIRGEASTDYAAITFDPAEAGREHALVSAEDENLLFFFRDYGFLRVPVKGPAVARGGWKAFRVTGTGEVLLLNGRRLSLDQGRGKIIFGDLPEEREIPRSSPPDPEFPLPVTISPPLPRMFSRDRREVTLSFRNTLESSLSGHLSFDLPQGVKILPTRPGFESVQPGEEASISFQITTHDAEEGMHTLPYRVNYRRRGGRETIPTAARAMRLTVGYVLQKDYLSRRPAYRVYTPRLTAAMDMFHGMVTFLADEEGNALLDGTPLFTFGDGSRDLLSAATENAFTWPIETPASLTAQVEDRARYQILAFADRIMVRMDGSWTQSPETHFIVPGVWVSPRGAPAWNNVLGPPEREEGEPLTAAAELRIPGGRRSLCFEFDPPQRVILQGTGMRFSLKSQSGDLWTVGFCPPGELLPWMWKKEALKKAALLERLKGAVKDFFRQRSDRR
jgi:hypothetical protein